MTDEEPRVYAVCLRLVGREEPAADLAQETFVKIIRGLPEFDGRSALSTWITRIAINTCLSWLRTRSRAAGRGRAPHTSRIGPGQRPQRSKADADRAEAPVDRAIDPREPSPAWCVQWEERCRLVSAALAEISPDHRVALVLRDVRGMGYAQIAEVLDASVGTIKSRLFRARAALREAVERLEGEPHPDAPAAAPMTATPADTTSQPGHPRPGGPDRLIETRSINGYAIHTTRIEPPGLEPAAGPVNPDQPDQTRGPEDPTHDPNHDPLIAAVESMTRPKTMRAR